MQGWDAPTPCSGRSARQLLGHLVDGQRQVLAMLAGEGPRAPVADPGALGLLAGPDPAGSWRRAHQSAVAALSGAAPGAGVATPLGPRTSSSSSASPSSSPSSTPGTWRPRPDVRPTSIPRPSAPCCPGSSRSAGSCRPPACTRRRSPCRTTHRRRTGCWPRSVADRPGDREHRRADPPHAVSIRECRRSTEG
ncbi:maleylpyruvate isomerase N-terminal domain-containing protein [Geodermatophilus sp. SYSU D00779]